MTDTAPKEVSANNPLFNSRYRANSDPFENQLSPDEIKAVHAQVRESFKTKKTRPLSFRLKQLRALKNFIENERERICEALFLDLHKNEFECYISELQPVLGEIDHALGHLASWMKPHSKKQTATTMYSWNQTVSDPLGCVLIFGAWNYPAFLLLSPLVGAICGGNCVVLKPGSFAEHTSNMFVELLPKYLDTDCFKVVEGNREVTNSLMEQRWDKIFYTGSSFVGRILAKKAAEHLTPIVLELGGKSPAIVDDTSSPVLAGERLAWGAFMNSGQTCVRPDFLLVHEKVADKVIENLEKQVERMYGKTVSKSDNFGRMINEGAYERVSAYLTEHKDKIIFGGKAEKESGSTKYFIEPTLLDFGSDLKAFAEARIMQDEIFGPIIPLCRFSKLDDAIDFVNGLTTGKPLALYFFSKNKKNVENIKLNTTSGGMCVNDCVVHLGNHYLPFGGVGNSGMGNYHGEYSFRCFTHEKAVLEKSQRLETLPGVKGVLAVRYPPYSKRTQSFVTWLGKQG